MALIAIWMAMSPIPIVALPPTANHVELTILGVPLAKVYAVGTVFAIIPLVIVTMAAIVIAGMTRIVVKDYNFLGSASPACNWGCKCRSQEKKTQVSVSSMHVVLRKLRTCLLKFSPVDSVRGKASCVCSIEDTTTGTCLAAGAFADACAERRVTAEP